MSPVGILIFIGVVVLFAILTVFGSGMFTGEINE